MVRALTFTLKLTMEHATRAVAGRIVTNSSKPKSEGAVRPHDRHRYHRMMTVVFCVGLWPRDGREADLIRYEDAVLALLPDHDGQLVARVRDTSAARGDGPYETQIIRFAGDTGFQAYMADERRTALTADRDAAIADTRLQRVDEVS
jgi:hypothetical protein